MKSYIAALLLALASASSFATSTGGIPNVPCFDENGKIINSSVPVTKCANYYGK